MKITVETTTAISELKVIISEKGQNYNIARVRLFYAGREMLDHHLLGNYKIVN